MTKENSYGYMASRVVCGWAMAVVKKAYLSVWAGAVMQKTPENAKNAKKANVHRPTDIAGRRVVSTRLKKNKCYDFYTLTRFISHQLSGKLSSLQT